MPTSTALAVAPSSRMVRDDLYFGTNIQSGGSVTASDWTSFVDETIIPRFPDGLTVTDGDGRYRMSDGSIVTEPSKIVTLFYPAARRRSADASIASIIASYRLKFSQESVMRVTKSVRVAF